MKKIYVATDDRGGDVFEGKATYKLDEAIKELNQWGRHATVNDFKNGRKLYVAEYAVETDLSDAREALDEHTDENGCDHDVAERITAILNERASDRDTLIVEDSDGIVERFKISELKALNERSNDYFEGQSVRELLKQKFPTAINADEIADTIYQIYVMD